MPYILCPLCPISYVHYAHTYVHYAHTYVHYAHSPFGSSVINK